MLPYPRQYSNREVPCKSCWHHRLYRLAGTRSSQALRDSGYATWHAGKWHLGGPGHYPQDFGFDVNVGGCEEGSPGRGGYFSPWSIPVLQDVDVPVGTYLTDYLTDCAIDLIRKYEKKAERLGLDRLEAFAVGEPFPSEHRRHLQVTRRLLQSDPVYAAMIESLDENVGKLLAALNRAGQTNNTAVFFTSDNGGLATSEGSPTCNAPLAEGKGWMYEGGTREPLLIKWPGIVEAGSVCQVPVTSTDFYPTILEMTDSPLVPDQHCDGSSLIPLLQKQVSLDREAIFWHYPHYGNQGGTPGSSIRMGDYKLIEFFEDGRCELYNLQKDLEQQHNLAEEETERLVEMKTRLSRWREEVEALIPQRNSEWKSQD